MKNKANDASLKEIRQRIRAKNGTLKAADIRELFDLTDENTNRARRFFGSNLIEVR